MTTSGMSYAQTFHQQHKERLARFDAAARRVRLSSPATYSVPNTLLDFAKLRDVAPNTASMRIKSMYPQSFADERAWVIAICGAELPELPEPKISIERIQRAVAEHFGINRDDILAARRSKDVVLPRHVAFYLSKKLTLKSLPEIGRRFGGRDHTTALHGARKIERMMIADPALAELVRGLAKQLGGSIE